MEGIQTLTLLLPSPSASFLIVFPSTQANLPRAMRKLLADTSTTKHLNLELFGFKTNIYIFQIKFTHTHKN